MTLPLVEHDGPATALAHSLSKSIRGEVQFDRLTRAIYATDASIYQIVPTGVVCPLDVADVTEAVRICARFDAPVVPRGAGTGLTGGAVGSGVQLDLSRHLRRIGPVDRDRRTVVVQPGVVLDELNAHLRGAGLMFAPDVATSSRATIGGMIANNSCGARSIRYGRTVDHVVSLSVGMPQGDVVVFERDKPGARSSRAGHLESGLGRIRDAHYDEILRRFPKVLRSNGGYGLDRLGPPGTPIDATRILCGSEGTLGIVVSATLSLTAVPACTTVVLLSFDELLAALATTPAILAHDPSAVELIDDSIIGAGLTNARLARRCGFLRAAPAAILAVEFQGDSNEQVATQVQALRRDRAVVGSTSAVDTLSGDDEQRAFWDLRKSGLGLLMSKPGDRQSYAFVEDSAVDPRKLSAYIGRFQAILSREQVSAGYYAHASVGCIHVRPVLNLKSAADVAKMRRIAESVSDLSLEFGGAMTGEHGDGIVRSCWLAKTYGAQIVGAFAEVKSLFDPEDRLNPHKIVNPLSMTDHLRYGGSYESTAVATTLDFSVMGGVSGMAEMCSGVGQCRQTLTGTMCPSFVATLDEKHTTRGRANALRVALSDRGVLSGFDDPALDEVMDLCISCKACKSECPTGVDMARLKAEYLSHRHLRHGATARARFIADMPRRLATLSRFPRLGNAMMHSGMVRRWVERRFGMDRRMPPPRLSGQTFRAWFRRRAGGRRSTPAPRRGSVIYFVDTWTNLVTPQVGVAAVTLLERAGFDVHCPPTECCGRPCLSQGLLTEARTLAAGNVERLVTAQKADLPVICTEPSCWSALTDEYPQLLRTNASRRLAERAYLLETFLRRVLDDDPTALRFAPASNGLMLHVHCHQRSLVGADDSLALLRRLYGSAVRELDAGCCGMAGAFGHEVDHYDVAQVIGERRLFPAIRAGTGDEIGVTGFSCRHQVEHATEAKPRHVGEILASRLEPS